MSYLYEPRQPSTCYRPQVFQNQRTSTADVETLLCEVYVSGSLQATYRKPYTSTAGGYKFDIDVQTITARNSAPYATDQSSIFQILDVFTIGVNSDVYVPYYLTTTLEARDTDGYLEEVAGSEETSSTLYSLPTIRSLYDMPLSQYYNPSATGDMRFLSNAPTSQFVSIEDNYFISWLARGIDAAKFTFFESPSVGTALIIRTTVTPTAEEMHTLGVGPANLLGTTPGLTILQGAKPTSLAAYTHYTFSVGTYADAEFTRESEELTFTLDGSCSWGQRLYWMGAMGGPEQYTFKGQIVKKQTDTGSVGEISPIWTEVQDPPVQEPLTPARGIIKTDIDTRIEYEIREPVTPEFGAWLRTLRKTPEVYIEIDGKYHACTIAPGNTEYERSRSPNAELQLTVIVENESSQEL